MREYYGYLTFAEIDQDRIHQVRKLAESAALRIDVGETFLEFEYSGRDSSRQIVRFLYGVAALLLDVLGEVKCELVDDDGEERFEFYSIRGGNLICQRGIVVRGQETVVDLASL